MLRFLGVTLAVLALCDDRRPGRRRGCVLETPDSFGDQVIYYYDARADFTTFIALRNGSDSERTVSVLFYGPSFGTPFSKRVTLPGGRLTIIDVGGSARRRVAGAAWRRASRRWSTTRDKRSRRARSPATSRSRIC